MSKNVVRILGTVTLLLIGGAASIILAHNLNLLLLRQSNGISFSIFKAIESLSDNRVRLLFFMLFSFVGLFALYILTTQHYGKYRNDMQQITPDISTPKASGNSEFGSARWIDYRKLSSAFNVAVFDIRRQPLLRYLIDHGYDDLPEDMRPKGAGKSELGDIELMKPLLKLGGLYIGMGRKESKKFYYIGSDTHVICIGATRSGKTRHVNLISICLQALAGESMVNLDPKGEVYLYTKAFLELLDYEVIAVDYNEPLKSDRNNSLQIVIDAINEGDIPKAMERTRDIVTSLVINDRTERVWTNGERSILASGILAVVYDNRDKPQYQNIPNVFHFIAKMCKPNKQGVMPLSAYLASLDQYHPARMSIDISEIAPEKMRGSFYTSALTTLDLFTDPRIYSMMNKTDFDIYATADKKRAIFLIIPDEKSTYYPIASLFIYQQYQLLVETSKKHGNRLPRRVNFNLDEFGNTVKIPDFNKQITVGGGRGIRFYLFVQDFNQIDDIYGDKPGKTIRSNAETWVYLQTDNPDTLRELSDKLDKYTIKSPSASSSTGGNVSASYNYTGRNLLTSGEIKSIRRPYQLVTSRADPAIMYAPDISKTIFNPMLGLGNPEHNKQLIMFRNEARPERMVAMSDVKLRSVHDYISHNAPQEEREKSKKAPLRVTKNFLNEILPIEEGLLMMEGTDEHENND